MTELFYRFRMFPGLVCIIALISFACFLGAFSVSARSAAVAAEHRGGRLRPHEMSTVVNLRDYGALGDGLTDDSPALQQALDDLADSGSGTLKVPAGHYVLRTPVLKQFAPGTLLSIEGEPSTTPINVAGNGSGLNLTSEFIVAVGETYDALNLSGLESLLIKDLGFVGVQEVLNDARTVLVLVDIKQASIQHCEFYGLASLVDGGAIVVAYATDLKLEQSAFLGCAANSGLNTSIVQNISWRGIAISDCKFVDYGNRPDFWSKTPYQPPYSWISIGNVASPEPTGSRREVIIQNVFLDEGSYFGISARPDFFSSESIPPYDVYLSRLNVNVNNLGSDGVYIGGARTVFIERSHFGWSHNAGAAIVLSGVDGAVLDLIDCSEAATTIRVDAQRLALINSVYTSLVSTAPVTRIITTDTPGEDPAQYVRQQYVAALNLDPDPAGHYYWTDKIVRCEADSACVSQTQTALAAYLSAAPPARFSAYGQVVDENGAPIPAVRVSLTGSQSVGMDTDDSGNFAFTNLPTAGSYMLTLAKNHYTFESQVFETPTFDQVANFTGTLLRHTISGRVLANTGSSLAGATVTLSGAEDETTTSDADGDYTFSDLAGGGDYIVTVSRDNYAFSLSSRSFSDLSDDQYHVFSGTLLKYAIGGVVTKADGTALSNVAVILSGGLASTTTTDAHGNYLFTVDGEADYTLNVARPNYAFSPQSQSFTNLSGNQSADFTATLLDYVISGRVTTTGGAHLSGVTVTVAGSQTGSVSTDSNDGYSFVLPAEGNYTITPSKLNYTFSPASIGVNNLSANELSNFAGELNPGVPVLLTTSDSTRALALDSVLQTTEPFKLTYDYPWVADRRTRLVLFATHFELLPDEGAASFTADVEDASHRIYPLIVEYAGKVQGVEGLNRIVVRLSDDLTDVGDVFVRITYRGASSDPMRIGIGHFGGGPPANAPSFMTGGYQPKEPTKKCDSSSFNQNLMKPPPYHQFEKGRFKVLPHRIGIS